MQAPCSHYDPFEGVLITASRSCNAPSDLNHPITILFKCSLLSVLHWVSALLASTRVALPSQSHVLIKAI